MAKPKSIKNPVRVSVVLEEKELEHLKRVTARLSIQEGKTITLSEAIRQCIRTMYPRESKQMSLFTDLF